MLADLSQPQCWMDERASAHTTGLHSVGCPSFAHDKNTLLKYVAMELARCSEGSLPDIIKFM